MKKHIVCFGDSNTHGYCADPSDSAGGGFRYQEDERWTGLLQRLLGDGVLVIEEGLSGRTTVYSDPTEEGLNGLDYLAPCLMSHQPVDLLVVMLGTNDTKSCFGASAERIARGMERLLRRALSTPCWGEGGCRILLAAPAPFGEEVERSPLVGPIMGPGSAEKSRALPPLYQALAHRLGCFFFDASPYAEYNPVDHMHLTRAAHARLARALADTVTGLV